MDILGNDKFRNWAPEIDPVTAMEMEQKAIEDQRKGKVLNVFDKIFGWFGKASKAYTSIRTATDQPEDVKPYDIDFSLEHAEEKKLLGMKPLNAYIFIGIGLLSVSYYLYAKYYKK